jgi:predicted DNA-binding transcriptional regulator YafY
MNKTDRLLAIVLRLQAKGKQRAEDLAEFFETSKRTIYRDIQALCEAGVPIVAMTGQGYALAQGYFLPPVTFNSEEAIMLMLGSAFVADNFEANYRHNAQSAALKLESVLPETVRQEVNRLRQRLHFISIVAESSPRYLPDLRRAVLESISVQFNYFSRNNAETPQQRTVDPYSLLYNHQAWYLVAHDYLRQSIRHFRLDRIEDLTLLPKTFERPDDFQLRVADEGSRTICVKVLFNKKAARWVQESNYFFITNIEEISAGLLVTLHIRREEDLVGWLLSWGENIRVLEPLSLVERLKVTVTQILANHQTY